MIKFPTKPKAPFKLDMVPLINIVFLLLIFFMLTTTTATKNSAEIKLPEAKTAEKSSKQFFTVTIDKNGSLQLDGEATTFETLAGHLEKKISGKKNAVVSIFADKVIEFELFGKVIALAKQAGAEDFMLATEQAETDS